ncbi:MAG: hypothetical protein ACE5Q6_16230 [Dehalococcoidia bacterium]
MKILAFLAVWGALFLAGCSGVPANPPATSAPAAGPVVVETANQPADTTSRVAPSGETSDQASVAPYETESGTESTSTTTTTSSTSTYPTDYASPPTVDSIVSESLTDPVTVEIVPSSELDPPSLSGELALFYRTSFSSSNQSLKWTSSGDTSNAVIRGGNITWENGSKGLVRLIPATGQVDLLKTVASPSWSKTSIYPVTYGGRLFAIIDHGADWNSKNKRFDIEELDPVTGRTLSRTTITGEWLTVVGDQLYYQTKTEKDFWGSGRITGGQVRAMTLGDFAERDLSLRRVRLHAVGDHLVSLSDNGLQQHDPDTGEVIGETLVNPGLMSGMWPSQYSIFYGDDAVYWARETGESTDVQVIRVPVNGEPEGLVVFEMEGYETGLTIDEHQGQVTIGITSSVPPTGLAVTQVFLLDTVNQTAEELVIDEHIPASTIDVGGGLQMLVMP